MPSPRFKQFSDEMLVEQLRQGEMGAFEEVYHRYWPRLHSLAYKRIRSKAVTEELLQDIFTKLWLNREKLLIHHSLAAYLLTAAKYQVLDYLQRQMIRKNYQDTWQNRRSLTDNSTEETVFYHDLQTSLQMGVEQLPPKCRSVFELSRQEELSVKEIADRLAISEKTVENHMSKALKRLRGNLKDYLALVGIGLYLLI